MTLWKVCNHHARFGSHRHSVSGDKMFSDFHVTSCNHLFKWLTSKGHHFAKFSGHRPCGSSDTAATTIYVILQDHVIKGSGNFMEGNSSLYILIVQKLIAIDISLMDI